MAYTFANLKTDCNYILWPDGVPENLVSAISNFYVEAMVEIQRYVPCFRERNESVFPQCSTYYKCGTTVLDAPRGRISKVYVTEGNDCQPVTYHPTSLREVQCWSRRFVEIVDAPDNSGLEPLKLGFKYPEASTDSEFGRALNGFWAIDSRGSGARIVIAPWIQSTESVIVEWAGLKTSWLDTDLVDDDPDLKKAVRMYVRWMYENMYVCDRANTAACRQSWDDALGELIYECREQTRQRQAEPCSNETKSLLDTYEPPTPADSSTTDDTVVIAAFGDYGVDDANEEAVANLVKGWEPDAILALGDNNYETGSASTIDENIGKYFSDYIYPYLGSYDSAATENKFWPVLGNHDLDTSNGQPYLDYFPAPINQRYYDKVIGNVHVFALNSGYNTAGSMVETAGVSSSDAQAQWLRAKMIQSTSKWKIVILHHSPYTNGSSYSPGKSILRWPFKTWGADAVISGHSHVYERLDKDGLNYYVVGTGGRTLDSFIASPVDQSVGYNTKHGALKITASCSALDIQFINTDGTVIDDGTTDSPYVPPASTFSIYWGRSTNTILTGAQISALSNSSTASAIAGSYSYVSDSGYLYFAVPASTNPVSIKIGSLDVPLAGSAEGYTQGSGIMTYELVTVGSTSYKLYRTYNTTAGATTLIVA